MEAGSSLSLKRRYEEVDNSSPFSTPKDSDDDISSSDSADSCDSLNPPSSTAFTRKEHQETHVTGNKPTFNLQKCLITLPKSVPLFSHLHPQAAQAVTGGETGTFRRGDGVLLPPAAGIHQRAQPGGQLPGHGPSPLLHQTLHPGRVCPRAGNEPPAHFTPAPAPREAQCPQDEGGAHILPESVGLISSKVSSQICSVLGYFAPLIY